MTSLTITASPADDELEIIPDHHNDLGDWCPHSGSRSGNGTCPVFCRHADDLAGFDAGDRDDEDDEDGSGVAWPDSLREMREGA